MSAPSRRGGRPRDAVGLRTPLLSGHGTAQTEAGAERLVIDRARRRLQLALGLVWLLDAALQFQPFMFGRAFATQVIEPTAQGNPAPVAHSVLWSAHIVLAHPILWNALFATVQLALALGLFWRRTVKLALAASLVWSLLVWWLGEGLGGILTGVANPLTGAPGAVILYALLALLAWPSSQRGGSIAAASVLRRGALAAWLLLWGSEAYFALQPANNSATALHDTLAGMADGEPGWLASLDRWAALIAAQHGATIGLTFAALLVLTAVAVLVPPILSRPLLMVALLLASAIWVIAQNFGAILTGQGTDPNSGLLLILLGFAYWPLRQPLHARVWWSQAVRAAVPNEEAGAFELIDRARDGFASGTDHLGQKVVRTGRRQ